MTVPKDLRVLMVEDSADDAELIAREIKKAGLHLISKRVDSAEAMKTTLQKEDWDFVIADYSMPSFSGLDALHILKDSGQDLPFILVSGTIGEEIAINAMKAGAHDYLLKGNLARLVPAIERERRDAEIRAAKKRIESERLTLINQLQEALRARDEFLLIASHELKTPLTSLRLHIQLIRRIEKLGLPNEAQLQKLHNLHNALHQQVERLTTLIYNLLDISRISVGKLTLEIEQVDLGAVIRKVIEAFREDLAKANCQVIFEIKTAVVGYWDPLRMEQVIVNLVGNAMKYAKNSPITITLESVGDRAILTVQDKGPGIANKDQQRLFQRFERAASLDHVGGLGLGLYINKQIVEAHGGAIRLESEPGKGSTFTVEVPLKPVSIQKRAA